MPPISCARATPPSVGLWSCAYSVVGSCLWCPPLLLSPSPAVALYLSWVPSDMAFPSPAHGTLLLSPSGCPHTTNPSPLPGNDLQSLSLSTQPPPEHLRLWCLCQWFRWFVRLSLCFLVLNPAAILFSGILEFPLTQLIFPLVRWLLRVWVPFVFHSSLLGVLVLS